MAARLGLWLILAALLAWLVTPAGNVIGWSIALVLVFLGVTVAASRPAGPEIGRKPKRQSVRCSYCKRTFSPPISTLHGLPACFVCADSPFT
jgi:hypothetical protein